MRFLQVALTETRSPHGAPAAGARSPAVSAWPPVQENFNVGIYLADGASTSWSSAHRGMVLSLTMVLCLPCATIADRVRVRPGTADRGVGITTSASSAQSRSRQDAHAAAVNELFGDAFGRSAIIRWPLRDQHRRQREAAATTPPCPLFPLKYRSF
jgi:hypothetical protein